MCPGCFRVDEKTLMIDRGQGKSGNLTFMQHLAAAHVLICVAAAGRASSLATIERSWRRADQPYPNWAEQPG